MQKILLGIAVTTMFGLAACERIPGTEAHTIADAEEKAAHDLRDPLAAQFREVKVVTRPADPKSKAKPDRFVCGEMNAKNAYGGYISFSRFFVDVDRDVVTLDPQVQVTSDEIDEAIAKCRQLSRSFYTVDVARSYCEQAEKGMAEMRKQLAFESAYEKACEVEEPEPKMTVPSTEPATTKTEPPKTVPSKKSGSK